MTDEEILEMYLDVISGRDIDRERLASMLDKLREIRDRCEELEKIDPVMAALGVDV